MGRRRFAVFAVLGAVAGWAAPAAAHPFGPPPTAEITAEANQIIIDWSATPDDAVAIGEALGVMPPDSTAAYRQESAAQVAPSRADEAAFSASPELQAYLLEHIAAEQDGQPCPGTVTETDDFVHTGAQVVLTCPQPVAEVDLRITMLHEIHPAYRTFAVGTGSAPGESVFTVDAAVHTWRFGAGAGTESSNGPAAMSAAAVLVLLLGAGSVMLARRRRRRARR